MPAPKEQPLSSERRQALAYLREHGSTAERTILARGLARSLDRAGIAEREIGVGKAKSTIKLTPLGQKLARDCGPCACAACKAKTSP